MKKIILLGFILGFSGVVVNAQVQDFLPENVFGVDYSFSGQSYDKVHTSGGQKSVLKSELENNDIDESEVSGSIKHLEYKYTLGFRYGLSNTWNFGVELPYIYRKRTSDLKDSDGDNSSFVDAYQSAESSGLGDYSLWLMWRAAYTELHNLQFGLKFKDNNADYNYDKNDELALGSGTRDVTWILRYFVYPYSNTMRYNLDVFLTYSFDDKIKDTSGEKVTLKRGASQQVRFGVYDYFKNFYYQAGVNYKNEASAVIDDVSREDGIKGFFFDISVGLSNLDNLEEGSVSLPWEIEFELRGNVSGDNLPATAILGLKGSVYF